MMGLVIDQAPVRSQETPRPARVATLLVRRARRATDAQVLEDGERLIGAWNERQEKRMPTIFSPTIGAAIM